MKKRIPNDIGILIRGLFHHAQQKIEGMNAMFIPSIFYYAWKYSESLKVELLELC
ncbi:MAG: hypothetical protein K2H60_09570 [Muribaculaceae bacterium]|nr:hypothetical protein [Muribaculaceae bacterium]